MQSSTRNLRRTININIALTFTFTLTLTLALAATGCINELEDEDDVHPDDVVEGQNAGHTMLGLARAGRWRLPDETVRLGNQQNVDYDGAPPFNGGANCSDGASDGALTLRNHLLGYFRQIGTVGIFNCRVIAGTNSMSLHGVGRALDIMIPTVGGAADNELGDEIANWLVENAQAIGVQAVIWDRTIWSVTASPRAREYTGVNPHVDHLHVELTIEAARENTRWFNDPFGPTPECETLPAIRAGSPAVVGNEHACFQRFGPADRWHRESAGHKDSLLWTRAVEARRKEAWAKWSLPLRASGDYQVQVFIDPAFGEWAHTKYKVNTAAAQHVVVIDQSAADGWTTLGTFRFRGDGNESVVVVDNHGDTVEGNERVIAVDAVRLRIPPQ